jgi:tetratricopeptide (TPR) repeat protein
VLLCLTLVASLIMTGFVSSAYRRERVSLGQLHFDKGRDLAKQGQEEAAVEEFRQALIFSPDVTEYRLALARALTYAGRLDEAESHLEQLQQEDPTNGSTNLMLARIAAKRKSLQAAIESYQRAVYQYWPADRLWERRQARWELIGLLEAQKRRSEVVGELMQMYASLPSDPGQKERVGLALLSNGALSEASQVFREMLHDSPLDPGAHQGMGRVYFGFGDYLGARHEFQRAFRLRPADKTVQQDLTLTNSVIDINPNLPHITFSERLRRSRNLLRAVITELERCSKTHLLTDFLEKELGDAKKLLAIPRVANDDLSLEFQDQAQQLWSNRVSFCGSAPNENRAVQVVIAGISQ